MKNRALVILVLALCAAGGARACDPYHAWQEASSFGRKTLSERALENLAISWLSKLGAAGKAIPSGATVALASVSDGCARDGVVAPGQPEPAKLDAKARAEREKKAAATLEAALTAAGFKVVPLEKTAKLTDGPEPSAEACAKIAQSTGAQWILSVRLRDYTQMLRVDADTVPANKGLLCQYQFETVRARIGLQDATGAHAFLDEAQGLTRDGWLFMTDAAPNPKVRYWIEYYVERPGREALTYQLKPGHSHLGLRP